MLGAEPAEDVLPRSSGRSCHPTSRKGSGIIFLHPRWVPRGNPWVPRDLVVALGHQGLLEHLSADKGSAPKKYPSGRMEPGACRRVSVSLAAPWQGVRYAAKHCLLQVCKMAHKTI